MIVLPGFDWVKGFLNGQRKTATIVMIAEIDHRFRMACRPLEYLKREPKRIMAGAFSLCRTR